MDSGSPWEWEGPGCTLTFGHIQRSPRPAAVDMGMVPALGKDLGEEGRTALVIHLGVLVNAG